MSTSYVSAVRIDAATARLYAASFIVTFADAVMPYTGKAEIVVDLACVAPTRTINLTPLSYQTIPPSLPFITC